MIGDHGQVVTQNGDQRIEGAPVPDAVASRAQAARRVTPTTDDRIGAGGMSWFSRWRLETGRLGGGFRLMLVSSLVTLLAVFLLPLALGLPDKVDPRSITSIANGNVNVTFLDAGGAVLAHRGYRQEENVPLHEMPPYLVHAVLAMEDKRFYRHWGVDILGVLRAARANFVANRIVEGGSTITQQLARNLYLDASREFGRKAQEAALAFWLEQQLSKDEILELYLNRIYLGAGAYGVEAASQVYFRKSVRELTLSEAALIAGLPKAPAQLSPARDLQLAHERAALVLDRLETTGLLPAAEIEAARQAPALVDLEERGDDLKAAYFLDWVYQRLGLWIDGPPRELVVETTIDTRLQEMAELALNQVLDDLPRGVAIDQGAMVVLDHQGAVKAMVGGRDYLASQFNRATQAVRQPGSAFKPIVYMAALENGYTPYSGVVDRPVRIRGWKPQNANKRYAGWMQLRNAVAWSVNTVAARVGNKVGLDKVAEYARRSGITTELPEHPSMTLGAVGTQLHELAGAYVPIANGGYAAPVFGIRRILNVDGDVLYERARRIIGVMPQPYRETSSGREITPKTADPVPLFEKVTATRTARTMTGMLTRVISMGTGKKAGLGSRQAAGKTGTTNDNRDALFVGYTADLVAGVWVGNDDNSEMGRVYGGTVPATIWASFMTEAHEGLKKRPIYRRYWVMPHPSQLAEEEAEEETEEEQVPALTLSSRDKALKRTLMDLSSALRAAPRLEARAEEPASSGRVRRMDRSVFRSRDD
ncbi:transglycosylase domain-containing protein [Pyruvatibacter mobilis]|uniref:transglycosylase domain-containing protein n=1 Tax=Pyruvatibacter mobilis TaxID=1712261 RepID=UPI003BA968FE